MYTCCRRALVWSLCVVLVLLPNLAEATTLVKANNTTALNAAGSWSPAQAPVAGDLLQWTSTVTAANSTALGGNLTVGELQVTNPGGAITISATTGATLTLSGIGGVGIDLSTATQSMTIAAQLALSASQSWNVAASRTLTASNSLDLGTSLLTMGGAGNQTLSGSITGTGASALTWNGTGTLTLSGANSFTGAVTLTAGTFRLGSNTALGTNSSTVTISGGTLDSNVAGLTVANNNPFVFDGNFSYSTSAGVNSLNLGTGAITLGAAAGTSRTITVVSSTLTVPGAIANGTTANSLVKAGAGILALSGANTYTGGTTVNAGVLHLLNTAAKPATGTLAVGASGTLGIMIGGAGYFSVAELDSLVAGTPTGALAGVTMAASSGVGIDTSQGALSYGTAIGGSRSLTKLGGNTLTLTNASTYTGTTTLAGGTLALAGGNNRLPSGTAVNIYTTGSVLDVGATSQTVANLTFPSNIPMSYTLSGAGGTLTVNGANDLQFGPGGTVSSTLLVSVSMSGLSNFVYNSPANIFRVGLQGSASQSNAIAQVGTVVLAQNNTITAASVRVSDQGGANDGGAATLRLGQANTVNTALINIGYSGRSDATLDFAAASSTLKIRGTDGASAMPNFQIGNTATFSTAAQLTFAHAVNFANGTVDADITNLTIGSADALSQTGRAGTSNSTFTLGATTGPNDFRVGTLTIGRISGSGTSTIGAAFVGNGTFTLNSVSGVLNATTINLAENTYSGTGAFTHTTSGTFNLTNGTVRATTIQKGAQTGTGGATATTTFNWTNGTIENTAGSDLTIANLPLTLAAGTHTFNATGTNKITVDTNSVISGAQSVTKSGPGTLELGATNTFSGGLSVNAGTVKAIASSPVFGTGNVTLADNVALDVNDFSPTSGLLATSGTGAGALVFNGGTATGTLTVTGTGTASFAGTLQDNNGGAGVLALTKAGIGTQTLTGNNTYTGGTTLAGGLLELGSANALGTAGTISFTGGSLRFSAANTTDYSARFSAAASQAYSLDTNNQAVTLGTPLTSAGGTLTKLGSGTLSLTATNTYTGATTINAGTLVADLTAITSAIDPTSPLIFTGTGTFQVKGSTGNVRAQTVNGLTLTGGNATVDVANVGTSTTLNLGALTRSPNTSVDFRASAGTFGVDAVVTTSTANDASGLLGVWATVNNVTQWAANNGSGVIVAYTGYTNIAARGDTVADGVNTNVQINSAGTSGNNSLAASTTTINTLRQNSATPSTIDTTSGTLRLGAAGVIWVTAGSGALTVAPTANAGTLTAGGTDNTNGDLYLQNQSTNPLVINSTIANNGSGVVSVYTTGPGLVALAGSNTFTGGTYAAAGTLALNSPTAIGTGPLYFVGGAIDNTSGAPVTLTNNNAQNWLADVTFVGSNSLNLGTAAIAFPTNRQVTVNANSLTLGGAISGTGFGLTKAGAGTLVLTGANTFTGATVINAGTLQLGSGGSTGALALTSPITNNGNLTLFRNDSAAVDIVGVISGTGSVTYAGTNFQGQSQYTLNDANTYTGNTTISGSRATVSSVVANPLGVGGTVTINDGGQFYSQVAVTIANNFVINGTGWRESTFPGRLGAIRLQGGEISGNVTLASNARIGTYSGSGTISGVISGNFDLEIWSDTATARVLTLNNANTHSGATAVRNATVQYSGPNGSALNTTGWTATNAAILLNNDNGANNTANNNGDRLGNTTPIALRTSTLQLQGINNTTGASSETVGPITYSGGSTLKVNVLGGSATTTLTAAALNRSGTGAMLALTTTGAGTLGVTDRVMLTAAPTLTHGIVNPNIVNGTDDTFVTYGGSGFANAAFTSTDLNTATTTDIVDQSTAAALSSNRTIYAGRIGTGAVTGNTLSLSSGGLILNNGGTSVTHSSNFVFGSAAAPGEALLHVDNSGAQQTTGQVTITGLLTANAITKSGAGSLRLNNSGNINNAGLANALITVNAGYLDVGDLTAAANGNRALPSTVRVVMNGGFLEFFESQTLAGLSGEAGTVRIGSDAGSGGTAKTLTVNSNVDQAFNGTIQGDDNNGSDAQFTKDGTGKLTLGGTLQIGRAIQVNAGELVLTNNVNMGTANTDRQRVILNQGGTFTLDNTSVNNNDRMTLNSGTSTGGGYIVFSGGTLNYLGNSGVASSETFGTATALAANNDPSFNSGADTINITAGSGQSAILVSERNIVRNAGASILFKGINLGGARGAANVATFAYNTSGPTLVGGAGAKDTSTISIYNGVIADSIISGADTYGLATYDLGPNAVVGGGDDLGVRRLNNATELDANITDGVSSLVNVRLTTASNPITVATTINALHLDAGSSIDGAGTLTINSGTILAAGGANGGIGVATPGTLDFGANEAILYTVNNLTIGSVITGTGGLTKGGPGTLTLTNSANTFSGTITANGGILSLSSNAQLGAATNNLVLNNNSVLQTTATMALDDGLNLRNITLGGAGAGLEVNGASLTVAGIISGGMITALPTPALTKTGSGTFILSGANSYIGGTAINAGVLQIAGAANRLPATTAVTLANVAGVALDLNNLNQTIGSLAGGGATGGNVTLGSGTLTVGDTSNTTYAGVISGTGNLVKQGTGSLTALGAHSYSGNTTVNGGTLYLAKVENGANTTIGASGNLVVGNAGVGSIRQAALTINGRATVQDSSGTPIAAVGNHAGTSHVGTLTLGGSGVLDLKNNDLIIDGGSYATVYAAVANGANVGAWNGANGILSGTAAAASGATALGVMQNFSDPVSGTGTPYFTTFDGQTNKLVGGPFDGSEVLVKYTYNGDFNLDGVVTSMDFALLDAGFAGTKQTALSAPGWFFGDADYNGSVDVQDYALALGGYNAYVGSYSSATLPEPSSLVLGGLGLVALLAAYRRRRAPQQSAASPAA